MPKEPIFTYAHAETVMVPRYRAVVRVSYPAPNGAEATTSRRCMHDHETERGAAACARSIAIQIERDPFAHDIELLRHGCGRALEQEPGESENSVTGNLICPVHGVVIAADPTVLPSNTPASIHQAGDEAMARLQESLDADDPSDLGGDLDYSEERLGG